MPPPLASVIVVNWNRRDLLEQCLKSLYAQTLQNIEIIVVDNGSDDGSLEMLGESRFTDVRTVTNHENRGFCAANNQGFSAAQGRYAALLNNDAEADPGWLAALVAAAEADPGIGMAASKIVAWEDPSRIDKVGHLIYPDGQNYGRGSGERDLGQYERAEEVAWPDGCAALYRMEMIRQIGGFDEDFFAYADDAELGLRARLAGWSAVYAPAAVVRHRLGSTLGRYSARRLFLIERNRVWLAVKLFPARMLAAVPFYHALRVAATAAASALGRGEGGRALGETSPLRLIECLVRANWAALRGLPRMWRKRREVRRLRVLTDAQAIRLLKRFRIRLADLAGR